MLAKVISYFKETMRVYISLEEDVGYIALHNVSAADPYQLIMSSGERWEWETGGHCKN